ncbi:MAG: SbmA/BacA-like family transporter [Pseudomonadota bacterium]
MNAQAVPIDRQTWFRFVRTVKTFAASEVGGKARLMFAGLIVLLLGINGLNVVNSYVGRDFMTAIENQDMTDFTGLAIVYIGVLAASTVVAVFYRFAEERLGLLWREWLTRQAVIRYLDHRTYHRLDAAGEIANPDQRIADDVRAFTVTTLSFVLMLLNGTITVVAFSGVLWSISPLLFAIAILYAAGGSYLTIVLGHPLMALNYSQLDKEANFRADLIHVRENAESVALARREGRLKSRLLQHLEALIANFRRIIGVNRNLGFFTTGYNYLIQIIPALIVAPSFIRGEVEFGVITQSAMAFAHLVGAFSLIVNQFQSISSFAAVLARLSSLREAIEQAESTVSAIELRDGGERLAYERLTLRSPRDGRILVEALSVTVPVGMRVLVSGPDETAKVALFRATAGIWDSGEGRILRPGPDDILFLPERPYLPPGTLRKSVLRTGQEHAVLDERILAILRALDLERVLARAGGLDVERDWDDILSLGEQQLLAFARILLAKPRIAFLDRASTALDHQQIGRILNLLSEHGIGYLNVGEAGEPLERYDAVLELADGGGWRWRRIRNGRIVGEGAD